MKTMEKSRKSKNDLYSILGIHLMLRLLYMYVYIYIYVCMYVYIYMKHQVVATETQYS